MIVAVVGFLATIVLMTGATLEDAKYLLRWLWRSTFCAMQDRLLDRSIRKEWLRLPPPYWREVCHTPRLNPWLNTKQVRELVEGGSDELE